MFVGSTIEAAQRLPHHVERLGNRCSDSGVASICALNAVLAKSVIGRSPIPLGVFDFSQAQAADYYVSPSGSDGGPGTLAQSFQTIQRATSVMVAGDTAYIRAGIYPGDRETEELKDTERAHHLYALRANR